MFKNLKEAVKAQFDSMMKESEILYITNTSSEDLWETYLDSFETPEERQHHNCNSCKQFIRTFGRLVIIKDNSVVTVWDNLSVSEEYSNAVLFLRNKVRESEIQDRFFWFTQKWGVDQNNQLCDDGTVKTWTHLSVLGPRSCVIREELIDSKKAHYRDLKQVFKRGLEEISVDSCEIVLDLINQNSLYRGEEFKGLVESFLAEKKTVGTTTNIELFSWSRSGNIHTSVSKIRNSAIGTLLLDISNSVELDKAVGSFEDKVSEGKYKRPTAVVTKGMIEEAEKKIEELGLKESLKRRFATKDDINVTNVLFVNRDAKAPSGVFEEMKAEVGVNPKSLTKIEEISIDDFLTKVVPTASGIEIMPENGHLSNLVSLIAPVEQQAPNMFKWSNSFSWSYTNGVADAMKERVKAAGGNIEGILRFSIQWNEDGQSMGVDLDAHALEPNGTHISYMSYKGRQTISSGMLDVDMINPTDAGVENITWTNESKMQEGVYKFYVHNFNNGRTKGFRAQIEFDGQIHEFSTDSNFSGATDVAEVTFSRTTGFSIKPLMNQTGGTTVSREKWGVSTNKFQKVSMIINSPNHWNDSVGNRHTFFVIEGAKNDEPTRGFFNEYLKDELSSNRKVFEVLAGKLKVEPSDNQVTGIGFSSTRRNHIICRVEGSYKRTLKVLF